jgi:hypothetical protein
VIGTALAKHGQPVKRGTMAHDHQLLMLLTESAVELRDLNAIRQQAPQLEALIARDGQRLYEGIAHRAWGVAHILAGEPAAAQARLQQALVVFRGLDARWQLGRTLLALAEAARMQGDEAGARQAADEALQAFEALRAAPAAERARAALAALG